MKCTRKIKSYSKLLVKLNKCKELEEVVIKASKDLKNKEDLVNKWKEKWDSIESQLSEYKKETEERIDDLETDMEKILQEK